jgi:hypothetical protein
MWFRNIVALLAKKASVGQDALCRCALWRGRADYDTNYPEPDTLRLKRTIYVDQMDRRAANALSACESIQICVRTQGNKSCEFS